VTPADTDRVIATARAWLGTPYHDQASLKGVGCDCLGLARGVWREVVGPEPFPIPPYSRDLGLVAGPEGINRSSGAIEGGQGPAGLTGPREVLADGAQRMMIEVEPGDAGPGALVLFRMMPRAIAKHVGILTGPAPRIGPGASSFIHAYERLGVIEEPLTHAWRRRIAFAFLFPQR
jgi:cell wall-associated NlpC family hydrolase